jgi:lipopolysaccharide/colanic/teichoic acid biosynthesis glycosyltransferase
VAERHNLRLNLGIGSFSEENLTYQELLSQAREDYWDRVQYAASVSEELGGQPSLGPMRLFDARQDEMAWVNALPRQTEATRLIYRVIKRAFDLGVTLVVLPFALPLMALIAFLIALDTGSPIFFVQERTGMGGKRFRMYKFRTMVPDAERMLDQVAETNVKGELAGPIKLKDDPRVTRVGRILRRTSLDELPQVFNVLRGEMSLVGPRPTSWSLASYQLWQTERLNVRPGITGLWQVCDRGDTSFDEWLRWDIKYIERMSLWLDLQIILRTVGNVLARRGAH